MQKLMNPPAASEPDQNSPELWWIVGGIVSNEVAKSQHSAVRPVLFRL